MQSRYTNITQYYISLMPQNRDNNTGRALCSYVRNSDAYKNVDPIDPVEHRRWGFPNRRKLKSRKDRSPVGTASVWSRRW